VNPAALWPVIQRSLRVLLIAPAYAAAFAAMVFKPGAVDCMDTRGAGSQS
jgi:hypothetical protein